MLVKIYWLQYFSSSQVSAALADFVGEVTGQPTLFEHQRQYK